MSEVIIGFAGAVTALFGSFQIVVRLAPVIGWWTVLVRLDEIDVGRLRLAYKRDGLTEAGLRRKGLTPGPPGEDSAIIRRAVRQVLDAAERDADNG